MEENNQKLNNTLATIQINNKSLEDLHGRIKRKLAIMRDLTIKLENDALELAKKMAIMEDEKNKLGEKNVSETKDLQDKIDALTNEIEQLKKEQSVSTQQLMVLINSIDAEISKTNSEIFNINKTFDADDTDNTIPPPPPTTTGGRTMKKKHFKNKSRKIRKTKKYRSKK